MLVRVRVFFIVVLLSACSQLTNIPLSPDEIKNQIDNSQKQYVHELGQEISIFDEVAAGLGLPLRKYLSNEQAVNGKTILDLGAGSGVLSLIALKNGATRAVATDINNYAVANAIYNAERFGVVDRMDVRLVSLKSPGAYSVIGSDEKFDLIVSNPPQGKEPPGDIYEFSHSDPNLAFLRSILEGLKAHLTEKGKGVFALYYRGLVLAQQISAERGMEVSIKLKTENKNGDYYLVEIRKREYQS